VRACDAFIAGCAVWLAAAPARAAPPDATEGPRAEVAVLRPVSDDPVLVEASRRLQLELGASGLTSALVDAGGDFEARVALVREDGVVTIDVLGTPAVGATLHRRVRVPIEEGGGDPAVVAVLRGIRLEVRRVPPAPAPRSTVQELDVDAPARQPEPPPVWRFEAGLGVLTARPLAAAVGVGPTVAAAGAIAPHVSFMASFAGPFFTNRPPTPEGSAHTTEELGGIGLRVDTWRPVWNLHALGAVGLHHVRAVYDARGVPANPPTMLHFFTPQSVWNPAVTLAAGASVRVWRWLGVSFQVAAILIEPALDVVTNGRSVGTLGGPSLLPTLSAWTTLR
jgi:hypothetical protein